MGRLGINYKEVAAAIATLQKKQRKATVDNIREVLGTGSKSTIARLLREWKSKNDFHAETKDSIPSELLNLVKTLWETLSDQADQQVAEYRHEHEQKLAELQQTLEQSIKTQVQLDKTICSQKEEIDQYIKQNRQLQEALLHEQGEKIKIQERVHYLESCQQENQKENKRLHSLLQHMQDNIEHYQTSIQKLQEDQSLTLTQMRNDYELKINKLQQQLISTTQQGACFKNEAEQANTALSSLTHQYEQKEHSIIKLKEIHTELKLKNQQLNQHNIEQSSQNKKKEEKLQEIEKKLRQSEISLELSYQKIKTLEQELKKLESKEHSLHEEKLQLIQEKAKLEGQFQQMEQNLAGLKQENKKECSTQHS